MTTKTLAAILVLMSLSGDQLHKFGVDGKSILCVPENDLDMPLMAAFEPDDPLYLKPGNGHAPGFSFLFELEEMRQIFPDYYFNPDIPHPPQIDTLHGSLGFTSLEDRRRWGPGGRAHSFKDIWYQRNECHATQIERLKGTSYFRAKCTPKSHFGIIFDRTPDPEVSPPHPHSTVLATCSYRSVFAGPYKDYKFRYCYRTIIVDEFRIDYEFQEQNTKLIPKFDNFLSTKIGKWKENCLGKKFNVEPINWRE